jgi:hypothetical protein
MVKRREIGAGNVGCMVGLALLAVAVIIAMKVIPTRVAVAELQDYCEKEGERASLPRNSDELIADRILIKAQESNLPVSKEDIQVHRDTSMIHIDVKYRVVLDMLVYKYNWDVEHKVDRTLF